MSLLDALLKLQEERTVTPKKKVWTPPPPTNFESKPSPVTMEEFDIGMAEMDRTERMAPAPTPRRDQISTTTFAAKFADELDNQPLPPIEFWDDPTLNEIINLGSQHPLNDVASRERLTRDRLANMNFFEVLLSGDRQLTSEMFRRAIEPVAKRAALAPVLAMSDLVALYGVLAVATDEALNAGIEAITGIEDAIPTQGAVDVARTAEQARAAAYETMQIPPPRNTFETLVEIAPISMLGIPVGARMELGNISKTLLNLVEVGTPFTIGAGARRAFANTLIQVIGADTFIELFGGDPNYSSMIDFFSKQVRDGESQLVHMATGASPGAEETQAVFTGDTVQEVNREDADRYRDLGFIAGGLLFFPGASRQGLRLLGRASKTFRDLDLPDIGLIRSYERWPDLMRVHTDDPSYIARRVLGRMGGYLTTAQRKVNTILEREIGLTGRRRVRFGAMGQGRMESTAGTFEAKDLSGETRPYIRVAQDYARLPAAARASVDAVLEANARLAVMSERGVTILNGVRKSDLERRVLQAIQDPNVAHVIEGYRANMGEALRFAGTGAGSIFTPAEAARWGQYGADAILSKLDSLAGLNGVERALQLRSRALTQSQEFPTIETTTTAQQRISPVETLGDAIQHLLEARMQNEARLQLINEVRRLDANAPARVFKRISRKQAETALSDPGHAAHNRVVSVLRNGKTMWYATSRGLADTLKFDLPGVSRGLLYHTKRLLEQTTTGYLRPQFGLINAVRVTMIGKVTARSGFRKPSYRFTAISVPLQGIDRLVYKGVSDRLYNQLSSDGLIVKLLGDRFVRAAADRMALAFERSLTNLLLNYGGANAGLAQHQLKGVVRAFDEVLRTRTYENRFTGVAGRAIGRLIGGLKGFVDVIQGAPNYGFVARNVKRKGDQWVPVNKRNTIEDVVWESRDLAGDPTKSGQYTVHGRPFGLDPVHVGGIRGRAGRWFTAMTGWPQQKAREIIPWWNPMVQGIARSGRAFMEAPLQTSMRAWIHVGLPSAAIYLWNLAMSTEEDDYIEHMLERRSEWFRTMYLPIALPGRPPEGMLEIPLPHEWAIMSRMMQVGMDFIFRTDRQDETFKEQALDAVAGWLNVLGLPSVKDGSLRMGNIPTPPLVGAMFGAAGVNMPQGVFAGGGDAFMVTDDPFDERDEIPARIELITRSLFGAISQSVLDAYTAFAAGNGDIKAALEAFGDAQEMGTIGVREALGHTRASSVTPESEKLFAKSGVIDAIMDYYREWDPERLEEVGRASYATVKELVSNAGTIAVANLADDIFTHIRGLPPYRLFPNEPPTNVLYTTFAWLLYDIFEKDTSALGDAAPFPLAGWQSMWRVHGQLTDSINDLRAVNHGNLVRVASWLNNNPDLVTWLRSNGIEDIDDLQDVRDLQNRLILTRQSVQRTLLEGIELVEDRMSELVGTTVRMEDLDPHGELGTLTQSQGAPPTN